MLSLKTPSASGGGFFGKIFFWVAIIVVALIAGFCSSKATKAQEQTGSTTQFILAAFFGTQVGSHSFVQELVFSNNNGTADYNVPVTVMGGNGLSVPASVSDSETGSIPPAVTPNTVLVRAGEKKKIYVRSNPVPLFVGWVWADNPAPGSVSISGSYGLLGPTGIFQNLGFFQATSSVGSTEWTFPGLKLGVVPGYSQRLLTLFVDNPSNTASVTCSAVSKFGSGTGTQLRRTADFSVAPRGQYFDIFDSAASPQENAWVEVTCNGPVLPVGAPFLNAASSIMLPQLGIFHPAPIAAPIVNLEAPVEGQTFTGTGTNLTVQIGGWAVVPGGNVAARPVASEAGGEVAFGVDVSLDGGTSFFVPLDVARQDVFNSFAGQGISVPLNCGFSFSRLVANGNHSVRVVATNDVGVTTEQIVNFVVRLTQPPPNFDGNYAGDLDSGASTPAGMSAHWVMTISGGKITKLEIQNWHLTSCNEGPQDAGVAVIQTINGTTNVNVIVDSGGNFQMGPRLCDQLTGRFVGTTVEILYIRFSSCKVTLNCTSPSSVTSVVKLTRQ